MSRLKLVGAQTYFCAAIQGGSILRGQVKEVEDENIAAALLSVVTYDKRNNIVPVFELVEDGQEPEETDDETEVDDVSGDTSVVEPKRRVGRTSAKV